MKTLHDFFNPPEDKNVEEPKEIKPVVEETVGVVFNTLFNTKLDSITQELKNCTTKEEVQSIAVALIEHVEKVQKDIQKEVKACSNSLQEKTALLQKKLSEISAIKEEEERKNKAFVYESVTRQEEKANRVLENASVIVTSKVEDLEHQIKEDVDNKITEFVDYYNKELKLFSEATKKQEREVKLLEESLKNFITESKSLLSDDKYIAINNKIKQLENILENFNEKTILVENILTAPPSTQTSDPLTPLDQNFVTHEQLVKHYQLFINRVQQQLTTLGGGGAAWLKDLQDVNHELVRTATDGQVLTYNAANALWEVSTVSGGGGSVTSVAGATGVVSNVQLASGITSSGILTTANVVEDINLYFSNSRVYGNVVQLGYITSSDLTTSNVTEDTNLYFSNSRVYDNVIQIGYTTSSDLTTANVTEDTNLYFSNSRVYNNVIQLGYLTSSSLQSLSGNIVTSGNITTNVLKIEDGVHEALTIRAGDGGGFTSDFDCSTGYISYCTSVSGNWTANFINLNLAEGYATVLTLVIEQSTISGTPGYPSAVQIEGSPKTLIWQGNTSPTPTNNGIDVVTFSILRTGISGNEYVVLGQMTGF